MISEGERQKMYVLLLSDIIALLVAMVLAVTLRFYLAFSFLVPWERIPFERSIDAYSYIILLWLLIFRFFGLYNTKLSGVSEFFQTLKAVTLSYLIVLALTYFYRTYFLSRGASVIFYFLSIISVLFFRKVTRSVLDRAFKTRAAQQKLLIIGFNKMAKSLCWEIARESSYCQIVGFISDNPHDSNKKFNGIPVLGMDKDMKKICRDYDVDEVIIALPCIERKAVLEAIDKCFSLGMSWRLVTDQFSIRLDQMYIETVGNIPLLGIKDSRIVGLNYFVKRSTDIIGSLFFLILFSPLMLTTALFIKLSSPGKVIFKQQRLGYHMKRFTFLKFRSMRFFSKEKKHKDYVEKWIKGIVRGSKKVKLYKMTGDRRITVIGRFIRWLSIDELPPLFNVVEEMKIAAGLPNIPKIYIINEEAPNAFATGIKPEKSAIAVTAGLLSKLNRDELQGVVAHETGHIFNRDIRFMTIAGIMLGSIVLISEIYFRGMWITGGGRRYSSKSSRSSGQAQLIIMIAAIALAILAPIIAQLLYLAISRKREYLADATAVRFTRYPEGLASALEKISQSTLDLTSANKVTAPMYIVNPLKPKGRQISDLTSTHPPISERIRILRSISQGAGYLEYQTAFDKIKRKASSLIPASALAAKEKVELRKPGEQLKIDRTPKQTKRTIGDLMMTVNSYSFLTCVCGMKIKVPAGFGTNKRQVICPRCGHKNDVPSTNAT
jgi:heat shock protein HtpX